jgi:outer membrane protein OmpA-like peptidoglycan-associated protein
MSKTIKNRALSSMGSLLLAGGAIVALSGTANAGPERQGWYVGIEGGVTKVEDARLGRRNPTNPSLLVDFDRGTAFLGTLGYDFSSNWRIEGEVGWRDVSLNTIAGVPVSSALDALTGMINILWDEPITEELLINIGAGAGYNDTTFTFGLAEDSDAVFTAQGIFGLTYRLGQHWDVALTYRGAWSEDLEFATPASAPSAVGTLDPFTHIVTIGLRYGYDDPPAPPVVVAPVVTPQPPKTFIIFFGFNKCNITAEADAVLSEAAAAAKSGGSSTVAIEGHTDTSGSAAYNQKLSECRANAAKANLVGKGVAEGAISTSGKGESQLIVQTGDGVKEPQNRRATINLN